MGLRSSGGLRSLAALGTAVVVVAGSALLLSEVVLPRAGARWLSHWQEAGLPGQMPQGLGPTFHLGIPPSLSWSDVRWNATDSIRVACGRLDISVRPLLLMRGRLQITRISTEGLRIDAGPKVERWCRAVLEGLADTLGRAEPARTSPAAIRFEARDVEFGGGFRFDRLSGWGWTPRHATWGSVARLVLVDGRGVELEAHGSGIAGAAEIEAEVSSGPGRRIVLAARRGLGDRWTWRSSAQDDGRLLLALPPLDPYRSSLDLDGAVDLWLERGERGALDGEAHLQGARLSIDGGAPWDVEGTICVGGDTVSIEDLDLGRGATRITGGVSIPIAGRDGTGPCTLDGAIAGHPFHLEGQLRRTSDQWTLDAPSVRWGDQEAGPLELTASLAARPSVDRLRGELVIGQGALSLRGGAGTMENPFRLGLSATPIERIQPFLPLSLPGKWVGMLRTDAQIWKEPSGWRAAGGSTLSGGRVSDLPLLEEFAGLVGNGGRSSFRVDRARARWLWDGRRIWADSIALSSNELTIMGSIGYVSADSILGLLRIEAGDNGSVGRILRLIGGKGGLDLGISGGPARPYIQPLDKASQHVWRSRMVEARPR